MMRSLRALGLAAFNRVAGDLTREQIADLLVPWRHSTLVRRQRAGMIVSRVRLVAALFAVLTPLWIVVDTLVFEWSVCVVLAGARVAAALAFGFLAARARSTDDIHDAYAALASLLAIPTIFFLVSKPTLGVGEFTGLAAAVAAGYAFLPFVMVTGLSVFPITAFEGAVFALPMIVSVAFTTVIESAGGDWTVHIGTLWLLLLIAAVATLAGTSQLHFIMALVAQAAHDSLTRAYTRHYGEEMLALQFEIAQRMRCPLSVVFIDLDHFKAVNDRFGHEEGDRVLRRAAEAMRETLRRGDVLVRWGGEEFLFILPNTGRAGAMTLVNRLQAVGLGVRPDGQKLTASIGVAELNAAMTDWSDLVEHADRRMYRAKQGGRNRVVFADADAAE